MTEDPYARIRPAKPTGEPLLGAAALLTLVALFLPFVALVSFVLGALLAGKGRVLAGVIVMILAVILFASGLVGPT